MLNIDEIDKEILMLEGKDTTYAVCEKLAYLYIVRDHLASRKQRISETLNTSGDSEFLEAANGKDSMKAMGVIDELMTTLKVINPRLHDGVIRKLKD